ncbi:N-acetylglucosaminidase [Sporofaciens musculi]|uniref:N-acetylglucosaminidase n=1 Tax=Sporofaciens musculi TaxID=2681861 RepID=UPI0025A21E0B|nr:glucosaminidase domain-containing protein [Sporofaciens musculi]
MQRIRRFLVLTLLVCLGATLPGIMSHAEEMSGEQTSAGSGLEDENSQRLDAVTAMDEAGNIFEVDEEGGELNDPGIAAYSRDISVKVVNFRTKGNAVTNYTEYGTGAAGYTNGAYGADAAYLGTNGGKVRFMLSGVVGEVSADEVQVVDFSNAKSISYYAVEGGRLRHYITQDMSLEKHATSLDNGSAPTYLQAGVTYYSYDGHYFYTDYGTMIGDYQNETRAASVNSGNPYYNYYQYLPFRSRTSYSGQELNSLMIGKINGSSKLNNTGDYFTNSQNTYGVNALIMTGIAANESGWGTSSICQNKNNLFGLNAVDASPGTSANTYASVEECIRQFADGWMSRKYLNPNGWTYKGGFLGNKASGVNVKYASDPYWGEKAANIIWLLDGNGGGRDAYAYTIGIKDTIATGHTSVNVRNGSSQSSASLYKTGASSNYAVLLQDMAAENGYYRIQSDGVLSGDRSGLNTKAGEYQFEQMFAYIHSDYVAVVNQGGTVAAKKELQSVTISQAPAKTVYTAGEVFDPAGMVVTAGFSDGSQEDVTSVITYSQEPLQAGTGCITVSYTYEETVMSAEQAITVNESAATPEPDEGQPPVTTPTPDEVTPPVTTPTPEPTPDEVTPPVTTPTPEPTPDGVTPPIPGTDSTAGTDSTPSPTPGAEDNLNPISVSDTKLDTEEDGNTGDTSTPEATLTPSVKNDSTGIWVRGGTSEGVACMVEVVAKDSEPYHTYIEPVKDKVILGVYDISLTIGLAEGETTEVGIPVGEQYNGKKTVVLHYDSSKGLERFTPVVENGEVVVRVSGFSPFVVALDEAPPASSPKAEQKPQEAQAVRRAPVTGDESQAVLWGVLLTLSFGMISMYLFSKKRIK